MTLFSRYEISAMLRRLVIDASVAAKWFLRDEIGADLADTILLGLLADEIELHAPQIFYYEVGALLARACGTSDPFTRQRRLERPHAARSVKELFGLPIRVAGPTEPESLRVLEMSVVYSKSYYDMTYLHLAQKLDCQWCTADDKILKGSPKHFPSQHVVLLSHHSIYL